MSQFVNSYTINPWPLIVMSTSFIILGFLGVVSVIPATAGIFPEKDRGWVTIGKNVALFSLSVTTIYFVWFLATMSERINLFQLGHTISNPHAPMNWIGWFAFGGMGLWVAVVGILVLLRGVLPKGFAAVCAIKTLGFWLILTGIVLGNIIIAEVGAVIGGIIGGASYHAWLGVALLRKASKL